MPRATKFYDVMVDGKVVFHGSFADSKKCYVAVKRTLDLLGSSSVVTLSFIPTDEVSYFL